MKTHTIKNIRSLILAPFKFGVLGLLLLLTSSAMAQNVVSELKMAPTQKGGNSLQKTVVKKQSAQSPKTEPKREQTQPKSGENRTNIYLENADFFTFDEAQKSDAQLLKGNVCFRHDEAFLYCDSAYFYQKANSLDAFGHVKIVQGDTLFIYGDKLFYNGDTKLARLRKNVRMINRDVTLETDSLNYDRVANVGYYFTGGKLFDEENVLTSVFGYYYPNEEMALFRRDVELTNPKIVMTADTLKYFTQSAVAEMLGPTTILYEGETTIYSEQGNYETRTEKSTLTLNSWVKHVDGQRLMGDTIFYDKRNGEGRALQHVELLDSANQSTFYGNFLYYKEEGDIVLAYDSALLVEHSSPDTIYMNADTIYAYAVDSTEKIIEAYYNVRIFRHDMQAVCDSASLETRDSVFHLMKNPVAWSGVRQLSGDTMHIYSLNGEVERMHVVGSAFVAEHQEEDFYNQLSGKELFAFIADNELRKIDVRGNAESIFFPLDEDSLLIGLNQTASSFLVAHLYEQKIERIVLQPSPTGVMTPIAQLSKEMLKLPGFSWQIELRPDCWQAVFDRPQRETEQANKPKRRSGRVDPTPESENKIDKDKSNANSGANNINNNSSQGFSFSGTSNTSTLKTNTNSR